MDVKSAFLYGTIKKEVYVCQPPGFEDPDYPDKRGKIDQTLFIKRQKSDILLVQIYVDDIIFDGKLASTPIDTEKPLLKDPDGEDVDVHTYRSLIGSFMYLTSSRPNIMFAVCACARFQVTPKASHLHAVKRIFRYLKGKPHLGLWYPKDSPFNLVAYSDSDYTGASLDRKSTTKGMLISWMQIDLLAIAIDSESSTGLWVVLSGMESLKRMLHVTNILSGGYLTTPQMVLNSPCLTHIKIWLVQIKGSLSWLVQKQTTLGVNTSRCDEDRLELIKLMVFLLPSDEKVGIEVCAVDLQVFAVWLILLLLVQKFLLFGLTNWCCSLTTVRSSIKYALTVNPNIYVSYIKQLWTSVAVKKVNNVTRLQALVDKKRVIITKATIRDALRLDDAEGIEYLPNEEIFDELARMGYEKPSTKLTFYKAFFSRMIVEHQVGEGADEVHVEDVSTASVAAEGAASVVDDEVPAADKIAQALEITNLKQRVKKLERRNKLKVLKLRRLKKVGIAQKVETSDDTVMDDVSKQGRIIADMDDDKDVTLKDVVDVAKDVLEEKVVEVVTAAKLITKVVTAASTTITAAAPQLTTAAAPTLTTASSAARRRKGVVIRDPEESATPSSIIHSEAKSKDKGKGILVEEPKPLKKQAQIEQDEAYARELEAKLNKNIDWDEVIDHVQRKQKEDNVVKRYQALKRKPHTEAQARKNMMIYLKNVAGFKMNYFKGMTYDDIRLIFKKKFNSNVAFLQKTKEQMDEEDSRVLKRLSETQEEKAAKKQKLDEEVAELKRHLQIVPNDEDDVYTEATPLAHKVPVVDYEIYIENNKPYYKIKRADGSHQLYLSFLSMLRNFDREDLEVLWQLVKERFASTKPNNFSDDFLLITLGAIFKKPDIITFTTTHLILLVERRYPLTRFTLDQLINTVWLEVEEESEESKDPQNVYLGSSRKHSRECNIVCTNKTSGFHQMAISLIDHKVRANTSKQAGNKRKWDNHSRDNHVHQKPFKKPNVARAYTVRSNEKKAYLGNLPYCNKCKLHHTGPCTVKCVNYKSVGHMMKDCKTPAAATNQRAHFANQKITMACYECGRHEHYKRGKANQESNVVTGKFLLNNRYTSLLFDSRADMSFVSNTFSFLIDIIPTASDVSYVVELADGRVVGPDSIN
nr:hypothetical protein [Tanacetum cinerariifolium]